MLIGTQRNPVGPSFRRAKRIEKELSGTRISFVAPGSKPPFPDLQWGQEMESLDLFDQERFKPVKGADKNELQGLSWAVVYSGSWEFRGLPIVHGYCGHVNCVIDVHLSNKLPVNESLFDPKVLAREVYNELEKVKLDELHDGHSDDSFDLTAYRWPSYLAPINNQWVSRGGAEWIYFEIQPLVSDGESFVWSTAISDKHYLVCYFHMVRSAGNAGNPYRIEERVARDNFLVFMHQIMDSFKLDLSAEAKAEQAAVVLKGSGQLKPVYSFSAELLEQAKHVLYMHSGTGYKDSGRNLDERHRADPKDVAAFLERRIKQRQIEGGGVDSPSLPGK